MSKCRNPLRVLQEAGPGLATDGVEAMRKDVLVNTALARLRGTRWLPVPLRASPP
jgi:ParB family transcriptional regulator, chromosome partitioning protein